MAVNIQLRRGTAAAWTSANPVLADGEAGVENDTHKVKLGDGVTAWTGLPYATGPTGAAGADGEGVPVGGVTGEMLAKASATDNDTVWAHPPQTMTVALSDEITEIVAAEGVMTFRAPFAMTLTQIPRASLTTAAATGTPTVDIKKNGTTIFTAKVTIDATEKTSTTAAVPAVLSTTAIADDDEITFDIDAAGTAATGLKATLYYRRA